MTDEGPRYREWPPALRTLVACTWAARFGADGRPHTDRILPDGCIDLVWTGRRLLVAGPDTRWTPVSPRRGASYAGVRFRPGTAPAILGVSGTALLDARPEAVEVLGERARVLVDRLARTGSLRAAARALEAAVLDWQAAAADPPDRLVEGAVAHLRATEAPTPIAALAAELGASERQLHRRFLAALGYGPKMLHRIFRLRRFLALAAGPTGGLAALATDTGYADQAHLARECQTLAGLPPSRLAGWLQTES